MYFEDAVNSDDEDENEDTRRHWHHQSHYHNNRGHDQFLGDRHGSYHYDYSRANFPILSNSKENTTKVKRKLDEVLKSECSRKEIDISKHNLVEKQVRLC